VTQEKEDGKKLLQKLQGQLHELEKKAEEEAQAAALQPAPPANSDDTNVEDSNESKKEDLSKIVEQLQSQVEALASEMRAKDLAKEKMSEDQNEVKSSRWKKWRRRIFKPWTMIRKNSL
jgi:hypothetical protein